MKESAPSIKMKLLNMRNWLMANDRGWRLLVGGVCVFCLALFLHFREVRLEVLELNTSANRYIVAQTDFQFSDYESTLFLKQQAMQNVGFIYQLNPRQIRDERYDLENTLIHTKEWRTSALTNSFEDMYKAIDALEKTLSAARFTDPRTIQIAKDCSLPHSFFYEFIPEATSTYHFLPDDFWERAFNEIPKEGHLHNETIRYVINVFRMQRWELKKDSIEERMIRNTVSKMIPEKFTHVQAGARIIEPGEKITSRHLTMMQAMKQAISDSRKVWEPLSMISSLLLSFIFIFIGSLFFRMNKHCFSHSLQQMSLLVCIILLTLLFAKLTEFTLVKSSSLFLERIRYPILVPFAASLICILLSPNVAIFTSAFLSIILSISLAVDHSRFLILNVITSMIVIICSRNIRKRKDVFSIYLKAWLGSIPILYAFTLSEAHYWSYSFINDLSASFFFLMVSAVLVVGLLPILETVFRILTDMTLMEYMDPNNVLLQKMAMEVPGTYQHCLVLANLAESCAAAIGANGLFCRAATLYHDIGKIANPQFYTENQQASLNIHQLLTPTESAQIIISHVADGERLAYKHRLPQSFIDIIRQHHGTTLVYYFYCKQLELKGGHKEEVNESQFRYPGPKPQTKEAAIVMICDCIEAASRSWQDVSEQTLTESIDRLIAAKAEEGQFDECNLTFEELSRLKHKLVKSLLLTHHIRVKYPQK